MGNGAFRPEAVCLFLFSFNNKNNIVVSSDVVFWFVFNNKRRVLVSSFVFALILLSYSCEFVCVCL